jgi:hypothetical protein
MWQFKDKKREEPKIIKMGEMLNLSEKGETILEYGIPIDDDTRNRCIVVAHHQDKAGNIFEIDALLDLKKEKLTKFHWKRIYYGPLLKRLKSKIVVVLISLVFGIVFKFFFNFNIIYYSLGIITYQILEEVLIRRTNKKYEQKQHAKADKCVERS